MVQYEQVGVKLIPLWRFCEEKRRSFFRAGKTQILLVQVCEPLNERIWDLLWQILKAPLKSQFGQRAVFLFTKLIFYANIKDIKLRTEKSDIDV